jgi:hypothetical protein
MKTGKRILLLLLFVSLLTPLLALPVAAQDAGGGISVRTGWLKVYPEYDDPRLLVMYQGTIDGVEPPVTLRFLVPAAAEMYSAGFIGEDGAYSGGPPFRQASDITGWDEISFQVNTDTFRVEYYDPIIIGRPDKSIDYNFRTLYPIASLDVYVQEPKGATDYTVMPPGQVIEFEGFTDHYYQFTDLTPGDEPALSFNITYTKTDDRPSLAEGGGGGATSGGTAGTVAAIVAGVVVVALLVGFFLVKKPSRPGSRAARRRQNKSAPQARRTVAKSGADRFCTQCGKPVDSSHKFCPNCGAKIS